MNQKNQDLFFEENGDEVTAVTLTDADGKEFNVQIIASVEVEEWNEEFVGAIAISDDGVQGDELIILSYWEDEKGDPFFDGVEDQEKLETVASLFQQYFEE